MTSHESVNRSSTDGHSRGSQVFVITKKKNMLL